jgi:regulator of protease activity HflC (stomatin/prohibitin superfamily)
MARGGYAHVAANQPGIWMMARVAGERLPRGRRIVVNEWERMVVFRDGAVADTLGPGAYRFWNGRATGRRVDVRPWILHVPMQEVPTADGLTIKVSVATEARVVDPVAYIVATQEALQAAYLYVQVALRDVVAGATLEDVLGARAALTERVAAAIGDLSSTGLELGRLELKDIVLPSELKRAQAEVLLAKAEGLAALERARTETATLRGLANAARLVAESPALLELRLLQELGQSSGHTGVLGGVRPVT